MVKRKCFIAGCSSVELDENVIHLEKVSFHKLNVKRETYKEWIAAITIVNNQARAFNHPKSAVICSKHFTEDCFIKGSYRGRKLRSDAVPSIFPNSHDMEDIEYLVEKHSPVSTISDNIIERQIDKAIPSTSRMANTNMICQSSVFTCKLPVTKTSSHKQKYVRYTDDDGDVENASRESLRNFIDILKKDNLAKAKTIRKLQKICLHKTKQVQNLKKLYAELRTKYFILKDTEHKHNKI